VAPIPDDEDPGLDLAALLAGVERDLLGRAPYLTRQEVSERSGVPVEVAELMWHLLGFPRVEDDEVAFTDADAQAIRYAVDLQRLGVLGADSQAALVRTWGRSFARLAEWQTGLLAEVVAAQVDPEKGVRELSTDVLPRVEALQSYVWRRHLASAANRLLAGADPAQPAHAMSVCFVDIVGYTTRSKSLEESELVSWIEHFEDQTTGVVLDHGGRVIKTIGDEVLFVTDDPATAVAAARELVERGADEDDPFPSVRAGVAHGDVVSRLGDVYGETVNIAARLTSLARPGTVLVDRGVHDLLCCDHGTHPAVEAGAGLELRRVRRASVKGYSRLEAWHVRA